MFNVSFPYSSKCTAASHAPTSRKFFVSFVNYRDFQHDERRSMHTPCHYPPFFEFKLYSFFLFHALPYAGIRKKTVLLKPGRNWPHPLSVQLPPKKAENKAGFFPFLPGTVLTRSVVLLLTQLPSQIRCYKYTLVRGSCKTGTTPPLSSLFRAKRFHICVEGERELCPLPPPLRNWSTVQYSLLFFPLLLCAWSDASPSLQLQYIG